MEELISVIIPVFKVENYVEKCVRSVLNNSYQNLEVICIDDGSPDRCGDILDLLAKEDKRVLAVHQKNSGVSNARNSGLKRASGKYIAFVDSDDYIHPDYFKTMMGCMTENNADLVICDCQTVHEGEESAVHEISQAEFIRLDAGSFFKDYYARHMVWCRIYKRSDLADLWFNPEVRIADDTLFNLLAVGRMKDPVIYKTSAELYFYLVRSDSIVHTSKYEKYLDFGNWFYRHAPESCDGDWDWMTGMQAVKLTLSFRYMAQFVKDYPKNRRYADKILWFCYRKLMSNKNIAWKDKAVHFAMIASPGLYRSFRVHNDPTLTDWERQQKQ